MDKAQTLHSFYSSFGLPAYDENTVPDDAVLPYISYEVAEDSIGSPVYLSASLWYRSPSWAEITKKANEIGAYIGYGGRTFNYDDGLMWIQRGSPFMQRSADDDDTIRRMNLNISAEFISQN